MDLRDFTYINAIAKYQNITKAAESLYITQPTLSKFLINLEILSGYFCTQKDLTFWKPLLRHNINKYTIDITSRRKREVYFVKEVLSIWKRLTLIMTSRWQ